MESDPSLRALSLSTDLYLRALILLTERRQKQLSVVVGFR
jgi:hypothetical protein